MARKFVFTLFFPLLAATPLFAQQAGERYRLTPEDVESAYGQFNPVLSPDAKQIAIVRGGQIVLQPITGGWPVVLTSAPGGKSDLAWSLNGKEIAYASQGDIWDVSVSGGQPKRLTDGHAGPGDPRVATDRAPRWSPDGKWILFQSGRSGQNELWVVSKDGRSINFLATGEIYHGPDFMGDQHIDDGDGLAGGLFYPDPAWSPDGTRITYTERSREFFTGKLKLVEFDSVTGRAKGAPVDLYTAKPDRGGAWAIDKVSWSPDGKALAFTLQDTGWDKVYLLSAAGGQPKQLTQGESEDSVPVFSPDGKSLAIVSNRNAPEERHIWIVPVDGSAPHRLTNLPAGVESNPVWSPDGAQVYFVRSGPLESQDLYVASTIRDSAARPLTRTLPPNFAAAHLRAPELVHFKANDGLDLSGILYYPPDYTAGKRYPTVLWVHGGPEGQDTLGFSAWPLFLEQEGYVVFRPNYRGGIGYGEKFRNLNVGDSGGGEVQDIASAVHYLVERGLTDPKRIAVGGTSHGATMVHYAVTKLPELFVAAISYGGSVNRATFLERTNRNSEIRWEIKMGGTPLEKPEAYRQTDIIPDVSKIKAALLIQYGDADPQLPPYESVQLINALKKEGKPFLAFSYPGEYHEFFVREHRLDVWKKQQQFLREYLLSLEGRSSTAVDEVDLNTGR